MKLSHSTTSSHCEPTEHLLLIFTYLKFFNYTATQTGNLAANDYSILTETQADQGSDVLMSGDIYQQT